MCVVTTILFDIRSLSKRAPGLKFLSSGIQEIL